MSCAILREGGLNRISFGMQSARSHVLRVLDRKHTPGRAAQAVQEAKEAGFGHVNLDLIYGTPGETDDDWRASLEAAIATGPDHVSAYSLIVEDRHPLWPARSGAATLPMPDDDVAADRYLIADELLEKAGFSWYEVSNWATGDAGPLPPQPALLVGRRLVGRRPGRAQPRRRRALVERQTPLRLRRPPGRGPLARPRPRAHPRRRNAPLERVMLELRLRDGFPLDDLAEEVEPAAAKALATGLLDVEAFRRAAPRARPSRGGCWPTRWSGTRRDEVDEFLDPAEQFGLQVGVAVHPAEDVAPGVGGLHPPAEGGDHALFPRDPARHVRPPLDAQHRRA